MHSTKLMGLLGGTFDPIHHGHLRLAIEVYERLDLAEVRFIPAAQPPLREQPRVHAPLRLDMVQRAIAGVAGLCVDDRELQRPGPSYMVDTLQSLRTEYSTQPLGLILGMDAFLKLPQWYQWEKLITLAHLLVVHRPGQILPEIHGMNNFLNTHRVHHSEELVKQRDGFIFIVEIPALDISATQIRRLLASGKNPRYLLPSAVLEMIYQHKLYR